MFSIALNYADGRLYEAADSMGCNPMKKFSHITLPSVRYTLINSLFVCFTLAFTDFGAPKVLGGNYNVLATDIYKQVAGQFNMNMGAVVGTLLLIPAVISFGVDRVTAKKNNDGISSKAKELKIKDSSDYMLAGRRMGLFMVAFSLSANNIGGGSTTGLAQKAFGDWGMSAI